MRRLVHQSPPIVTVSVLTLMFAVAHASPALAQLPTTHLSVVFPPGAQAGSEVQVKVAGENLDDSRQLLFSHPGITAKPLTAPRHEFDPTPHAVPNEFQVTVAADVPPAIYEVRAVGRYGGSNPRAFVVGSESEAVEGRPNQNGENDVASRALPIELGKTINGRVAQDRIDYYRFTASRGNRILLACAALKIDSRMDATLVISDPRGRELMRIIDGDGPDPVGMFEVPADGDYTVGVYDFVYRGGDSYYYRLTLDNRPFLDSAFPPVGLPGSTATYTVYGRNLPGGIPAGDAVAGWQQIELPITLPDDANAQQHLPIAGFVPASASGRDGHLYQWNSSQGISNPICIDYALAPVVVEREPNNEPQAAQTVTLPAECCGRFQQPGDRDWFQFDAANGDVVWIDVISRRAGRDTDPYLVVQKVTHNEQGEEKVETVIELDEVARNDNNQPPTFDTRSQDPAYKLVVGQDATYRVMVRDLYSGTHGGPRMNYRLLIRRDLPDFRLVTFSDPYQVDKNKRCPGSLVLRRGDRLPLNVEILRRCGFDGEVRIVVEGLPAGITCHETIVNGATREAALIFTTAEDCPPWSGPIRVVGHATINGQPIVRQARAGALVWKTENAQQDPPVSRLIRDVWISVMEKETASATVRVGDGQVLETSFGGKLTIPIHVDRRGEFKAAIKLIPTGMPSTLRMNEVNVDGADGKFELLLNDLQMRPGIYTFFLQGSAKIKYARNTDAVQAAIEEQKQIDTIRQEMDQQAKAATAAKDAAVRIASEMANRVQQIRQQVDAARSKQQAAAGQLAQASTQHKSAETALQQDAQNQALAENVKTAQTAVAAAEANASAAAEALRASEQELATAEQEQKKAEESKVAAEKAASDAVARHTQAVNLKQQLDQKVTQVQQANQTKDVDFAVASNPVSLRIAATPVTLTAPPTTGPIRQGEQRELNVTFERKYGFDDSVTLQLQPPNGVNGISAGQINVEKGKGDGKLLIDIGGQAPVGTHVCKLSLRLRFNGVDVTSTEEIALQIEPATGEK